MEIEDVYQAARHKQKIPLTILSTRDASNDYSKIGSRLEERIGVHFKNFPWRFVYIGATGVRYLASNKKSDKKIVFRIFNKRDFKLTMSGWNVHKTNEGWKFVSENKKVVMLMSRTNKCPSEAHALYYSGLIYDPAVRKTYIGDWARPDLKLNLSGEFEPESVEEYVHNTARIHTSEENFPQHDLYKNCYMCKEEYHRERYHPGYNQLCKNCGIFNEKKRLETADLTGFVAVVTGGRQKIGYKTALKLLRCGATVVVTTRYPAAARYNYLLEPDHEQWIDRLTVIKCDFRRREDLYQLIADLKELQPNIIINNACQTVRPTRKYQEAINQLEASLSGLIEGTRKLMITDGTQMDQHKLDMLFMEKAGEMDVHLNKFNDVDEDPSIRDESAWRKTLEQIETDEFLETMLINQFAPALIIKSVRPFMRSPGPKFIINVTAIEGSFVRGKEQGHHPHTNMCKAALNMLTRTLASEDNPDQWICAIDPGFVSGVNVLTEIFPLTADDAASRILDPIINFCNGTPLERGQQAWLWKDYKIINVVEN